MFPTDGLLLALAAILAVRTLVGMMRRRSARLIAEVQKQVDAHREREIASKQPGGRKPTRDAA